MLARDPGDAVALNNSALCRMYACGLGEAIKVWRALVASSPSRPGCAATQFVWWCVQSQLAILLLKAFSRLHLNILSIRAAMVSVCGLDPDMLTTHMHAQSGEDDPLYGTLPTVSLTTAALSALRLSKCPCNQAQITIM